MSQQELVVLSLQSLNILDGGKAAAVFKKHLIRAAQDCFDRPADAKARTVTLQLDLIPVLQPNGLCDEVTIQVKGKSAVPVHQTRAYSMRLHTNGMLSWNEDSKDNVNQGTMLPPGPPRQAPAAPAHDDDEDDDEAGG